MKKEWYNLTKKEVFDKLDTSEKGLSQKQADKRYNEYGPNKLPKGSRLTAFKIFISQFKSSLVYVLLAAALVSLLIGEFLDLAVISAAILINVVIGFIQENKAERALEKLQKVISLKTRVIRDGKISEIDSAKLVPGDMIIIQAGDKIPADGRIIELKDLKCNEASLTGESMPVAKTAKVIKGEKSTADRENMVFMGTVAAQGNCKAVVVNTGYKTSMGNVASLVKETQKDKTPLQLKIESFSRLLVVVILFICFFLLIIGLSVGIDFVDIFLTSVAIAVAAIPEGLLIGATAIMAIGMQKILKRNGLVRKLISAETLGSATVICADKTGTLTEGKMVVSKALIYDNVYDFEKSKECESNSDCRQLVKSIFYCNDIIIKNSEKKPKQWKLQGSPTERALFKAAINAGFDYDKEANENLLIDEIPFTSERKYRAVLRKTNKDEYIVYCIGAPEILLKLSGYYEHNGDKKILDNEQRSFIDKKLDHWSSRGFRLIGVSYKKFQKQIKSLDEDLISKSELVYKGTLCLRDPIRYTVVDTIRKTRQAGIRVVMITGDRKETALAIAKELGLKVNEKRVIEGSELNKISDNDLKRKIEKISVYARVSPEDKLRIIDAWQAVGEVVAMTGDGVNDAPALKSADIGVAMGAGTDVAKEVADLVVLDNNFSTIVMAVEQGRVIYDNIKKVILYLVSDSFSEIILISGAILLQFFWPGFPIPLLAAQILWINLVTDGLPNLALAFEPEEEEVMYEKPKKRKKSLIDKEMKVLIFLISFFTGLANLALFYFIYKNTNDVEKARTIVFASLGIDSLLYVFSCRSMRHSILNKQFFSNIWLLLAVLGGFLIQLAAIYLPFLQTLLRTQALNSRDWEIILFMVFIVIVLIEITKWIFIVSRRQKRIPKDVVKA